MVFFNRYTTITGSSTNRINIVKAIENKDVIPESIRISEYVDTFKNMLESYASRQNKEAIDALDWIISNRERFKPNDFVSLIFGGAYISQCEEVRKASRKFVADSDWSDEVQVQAIKVYLDNIKDKLNSGGDYYINIFHFLEIISVLPENHRVEIIKNYSPKQSLVFWAAASYDKNRNKIGEELLSYIPKENLPDVLSDVFRGGISEFYTWFDHPVLSEIFKTSSYLNSPSYYHPRLFNKLATLAKNMPLESRRDIVLLGIETCSLGIETHNIDSDEAFFKGLNELILAAKTVSNDFWLETIEKICGRFSYSIIDRLLPDIIDQVPKEKWLILLKAHHYSQSISQGECSMRFMPNKYLELLSEEQRTEYQKYKTEVAVIRNNVAKKRLETYLYNKRNQNTESRSSYSDAGPSGNGGNGGGAGGGC
ncbi:Uncharacterised protein [uncultured archaeon]|nr:Uncharacterised protein [uncultured archaeon]